MWRDYAGGDVPDRKEKHKVVEQKRREKVRQGLGGIFVRVVAYFSRFGRCGSPRAGTANIIIIVLIK